MAPVATLALAAGAAAAGLGYAGWRAAVGLVRSKLLGLEQIHLDFSAQAAGAGALADPESPRATLLFFHETAADGRSAAKYLAGLEGAGLQVIRPDFTEPAHTDRYPGLGIFATPGLLDEARAYLAAARVAAGDRPLYLMGVSRGAALAALVAAEEPGALAGLILESVFSPRDVMAHKLARFAPIYVGAAGRYIPGFVHRAVAGRALAEVAGVLGTRFLDPAEAVAAAPVPALFLHGTKDPSAPLDAARGYAARRRGPTRFEAFAKARHNQACLREPARYAGLLREFLGAGP